MDYTKQCWSCGKVTMVNKGDYYQCSECGATHCEVPAPAGETYILDKVSVKDQKSGIGKTHPRPSFSTTETARKKREASRGGSQ